MIGVSLYRGTYYVDVGTHGINPCCFHPKGTYIVKSTKKNFLLNHKNIRFIYIYTHREVKPIIIIQHKLTKHLFNTIKAYNFSWRQFFCFWSCFRQTPSVWLQVQSKQCFPPPPKTPRVIYDWKHFIIKS